MCRRRASNPPGRTTPLESTRVTPLMVALERSFPAAARMARAESLNTKSIGASGSSASRAYVTESFARSENSAADVCAAKSDRENCRSVYSKSTVMRDAAVISRRVMNVSSPVE